jgi:hypothetical protein
LISRKQIRFLNLTSGGHERKFLEEAGSSYAILHEEEYFSNFSSEDLVTTCGDLALKSLSAEATAYLQTRVIELEKMLAAEQDRRKRL